ncbi:SLC13 family permease [Branchiibius cervicis]|uniref:SLC13 family permease n=1 Tax=Branchiibius cervicis TaxID=908252 RepID=A0ABW2APV5_9MICO
MSFVQLLSLILLAGVLVIAIWRRINIGVLALAAAFPVMLISGVDADTLYKSFPGNLVVLIAGVSMLFAHLERSGALAVIVERVYATVGDRTWLLPWAGFFLAAAFSTAGAFSTAPIAFLVPMIAHVTTRYRASFLLCELGVIIGANSAGLSPLNPTGAVIKTAADKAGVHYNTWALWAASMGAAIIVVAVLQVIDRARARKGRQFAPEPAPAQDSSSASSATPAYAWASAVGLLAFVVCVVVFKTDVGITSMVVVVVLQLVFRPSERAILGRIPWPSILLLTGLLTYLGLMKDVGTMDSIERGLEHIGTGALLILVIAYITVLLCNIESSTIGIFGLMTPLVFVSFGDQAGLIWVLIAVCVPAALMVMNPIHVAGTLVIANTATKDQDRLFRYLLGTAVSLAIVVPAVLWVPAALLT